MSNCEIALPSSPLEYALAYAKLGFFVFPVWGGKEGKCKCKRICKSPSKHPVQQLVPHGQDDATTDPEIIRRWWGAMPDAGIGLFLFPSGLMAIDIDPRNGGFETMDRLEAEHGSITSDVLAYTQNGGEHKVFTAPKNISLPDSLGPGVDLKYKGYIILEPTPGIKGVYVWEASSNPLEGAVPSPMPSFLLDLSSSRDKPALPTIPGTRHVTEQQAAELADALTYIPADERDLWLKIGMALHSVGQAGFTLWDDWAQKSTKYNPVDQIRVWRSFKSGALNYESVFYLAAEHGFVNTLQITLPDPVPIESVSVAVIAPKTTTPTHLLTPPGILGTITAWINATSRKSQPQFDVQAAIAFCSTVMGRRYCTDQNNWPSLYLLNIGKSASGKEHAKWAVEQMLDACSLSCLIGPAGYTSSAGVLSSLHKQPVHLAIIDEFGKVLEAASIKGNVMARSTLVSMMEAWGRSDGVMRPQGYSTFGMSAQDVKKIESRTVYNPALTVMGMATPDTFFESIGSASARDGFLNRFLIVESDIGRQAGKPGKLRDVPQSVIDWATKSVKFDGLIDPGANSSLKVIPKIIHIREDAQALFAAFEQESIEQMDAHDEIGLSEMFGRCCEQSMRLALIVAVADDWQAVNAEHAQWAIDYVRYYSHRAVIRMLSSVSDSEHQALCKQVFEIIRSNPLGVTERDINRKSRKFAAEDVRGKTGALNSLTQNGDIVRAETTGSNGKKTMKWFAVDHSAV